MHPGLPAGHYLANRDEKYVIRHQNMRSQGLTGLAGPIATSEIVLHYALSTLTKQISHILNKYFVYFFKRRNAICEMQLGIL